MDSNSPKKKHTFLYIAIGAIVLIAGGAYWWIEASLYAWTNDAYIDGFTVSIGPDVEARIIKLYVDEGDVVEIGQPICDLDPTIWEAKKWEAETNVNLLAENVVLTKIQMEKKRDDFIIAKNEYDSAIISFLDFDHKEKDFKISLSQHEYAQKELENAWAKLGVIEEELAHTKVVAPRRGSIAKRWILAGDVATFGQSLFVMNDLDNIWVTANLEETKVRGVKEGSEVKIHVDAYPHKEFTGKVWAVRAAAASQFSLIPPENATGNFTKVVQRVPIKIHIDVPDDANYYLFPGMSCEVKIRKK